MPTFPDLMAQSVDGMFAIDGQQKVLFWNRAAESMTGIASSRAVGRRCHEVLKGHDLMGRQFCKPGCPLSALAAGGPPPGQLPLRVTHTDGQTLQLCVGTMLIPSFKDGLWTVVHVMRRGRRSQAENLFDCRSTHAAPEAKPASHEPTLPKKSAASMLTGREQEILRLLANGSGVDNMAALLHISSATVRNHLQRLMGKLDVHNRVEAVAFAHKHQLV